MIKTLLGIRLRSVLLALLGGRGKDGKSRTGKGRAIVLLVAYIYVIAVFGGMFSFFAYSYAPVLIAAGLDWLYFALFTVVAFAFVFVFSIFETKSELFECKDNELLLSMPIKPRHIVISRLFTVLVYNYVETLLVMLPAIIFYIVSGGAVYGIIGSILVTLLLPLLATALSAGVGYLVALLSKKFKKNSFVTLGISIVFLGLYFWGYTALMGNVGEDEMPDLVALGGNLSGMRFIGEASLLHPIFTTAFVALSLGVSAFAYIVISKSYISIVTATSTSSSGREYKVTSYKRASQFMALVKKEFSMFVSSATYMLNSSIGVIFTVLFAVALVTNKASLDTVVTELSVVVGLNLSDALPALLSSVLVMIASLNLISASALSLEGRRFWILQSMPIPAETYLLAKTVPAIVVPAIPNLAASILLIYVTGADLIVALLLVLIVQLAGIVSALIGIVLNATFPKFDYENEVQVVKQSIAMFLGMLFTTLYGLLNIGIAVVFAIILSNVVLGMVMMLLFALVICAVLTAVLLGPIKKKYAKYSV